MRWPLFSQISRWSDFPGDVVVVVIGVLLALILQEIAQGLQRRSDVAAERAALNDMARANLKVAAFRGYQERCVLRRLGEIQAIFNVMNAVNPFDYPARSACLTNGAPT